MKKAAIILAIVLLICSLIGCDNRKYSRDYETYSETEEVTYHDEIMDEDIAESYDEEYSDDSYFGVTVDEVVDTYNRILRELNPNASQGDIDTCSLNTYTIDETQLNDGTNVNIYTYHFKGSNKFMGVNIMENVNTKKVMYVDLFSHTKLFENEKGFKLFQELYYYLTASVDDSITLSKFNEIWDDMSHNEDFSTVYNDKTFFCLEKGEGLYLGIHQI